MVTRNSRGDIVFVICLALLFLFLITAASLIPDPNIPPQTILLEDEVDSTALRARQGFPSFTRRSTC